MSQRRQYVEILDKLWLEDRRSKSSPNQLKISEIVYHEKKICLYFDQIS